MYWKNFISEKVTVSVTRMLFCMLILYSGLSDMHNAAAKETDGEIKGGKSTAFQLIDFTLDSPEGALSLKDLRGNVVLIFFGFTSCPDVCPISLVTISHAFSYLTDDELKRSRTLFISLDPVEICFVHGIPHPLFSQKEEAMSEEGLTGFLFQAK